MGSSGSSLARLNPKSSTGGFKMCAGIIATKPIANLE